MEPTITPDDDEYEGERVRVASEELNESRPVSSVPFELVAVPWSDDQFNPARGPCNFICLGTSKNLMLKTKYYCIVVYGRCGRFRDRRRAGC